MVRVVLARSVPPQPWRNGGGATRELLCWPQAEAWAVRVSLARVDRDGPFSAYAGVHRWFAVVSGAGVVLRTAGNDLPLRPGHAPHAFDGAEAPDCRLMDGPTSDLNLMLRGHGVMQAVEPGEPWCGVQRWRGLFTSGAGHWQGSGEVRALQAGTLLWADDAQGIPWSFDPDGDVPAAAWWLAGEAAA